MRATFDAVIAGAGPAGLAASIVLGRNGLRVLVCDRRPLPIDKPCGEGVLPTGLRYLRELDALNRVDPDEARAFRGIRVRSVSGHTASADFAEGPGLGIRRLNLSRALMQTAQGSGNVEFETATLRGIDSRPGHMDVHVGDRCVETRLVIGADGLNSRVRRWANLEGGRGEFRRLGARQHFRIAPWSEHVEVMHGHEIEAYVTPCGKDQVGVAFLWNHGNGRLRLPAKQALIPWLLDGFPELQARLQGAEPASPAMSTGPLHRLARRRTADGVILIGDAGGYLDACTGEGISLAFAQALALEQQIVPWLRQGRGTLPRRQLAGFETASRRITRPYIQATRVLLFLGRHPAVMDRFIATVHHRPEVLQRLFSAQMGQASFWPGWANLLKMAVGFVRAKPQAAGSGA